MFLIKVADIKCIISAIFLLNIDDSQFVKSNRSAIKMVASDHDMFHSLSTCIVSEL